MRKFLLCFFLLISIISSFAQSSLPVFASFDMQDVNMKKCSFDKDADAVILFKDATSNYDDEYRLITNYRVRIKILNKRGIENGTISIPFYSKDNFEIITRIEGVTFNTDENSTSVLSSKSIYTEKINNQISRIKFAMPNVREGSIIEYQYESTMKHYGGLDNWFFQSDLPTIKSSYLLQIIPNAEFSYVVTKKSDYPIIIKPKPESGQIYFEMNNIPGLQFEPYMDAPKDYLQHVEFQLSGYKNYYGDKKINTTWKDLANTLATEDELGGVIKKNLPIPADLKDTVDKRITMKDKTEAIYKYVQNNFTWNGINSKFISDNLKKVWEKKSGTSGDLNLILLNLFKSFNINAYPFEVAERSFGKVNPDYPLLDRFNKTVAIVEIDDNTYILDASEKYNDFGITPYSLLNTYGLKVDRKEGKLINISSQNNYFKTYVIINGTIDKKGKFSGVASIQAEDYAKQHIIEQVKKDKKKYIKTNIEESYEGLKIDSFQISYPTTTSDPLYVNIAFTNDISDNGGFTLFNYNLFTELTKNPFTAKERFTNINFGYPYHKVIEEIISIPDNAKTDLPSDKSLTNPDRTISVIRKISREGNQLKIKIEFTQTVTLFPYEDYSNLQEFYKTAVVFLNDPIVIKLQQ